MGIFNKHRGSKKTYLNYTEKMQDKTYREMVLGRGSEMEKNCERYERFDRCYGKVFNSLGIMFTIHFSYGLRMGVYFFFILAALIALVYAMSPTKTVFAYFAPLLTAAGFMTEIYVKHYTYWVIWWIAVFVYSICVIPFVHWLNSEERYLSEQPGFPYFRYILNEEMSRKAKALADELDHY